MKRISIRQILLEDIDGFHSCLDSIARERKYLGFTTAPSLEETRTSIIKDMERDVIRLIALHGSKVVGWCQIKPEAGKDIPTWVGSKWGAQGLSRARNRNCSPKSGAGGSENSRARTG